MVLHLASFRSQARLGQTGDFCCLKAASPCLAWVVGLVLVGSLLTLVIQLIFIFYFHSFQSHLQSQALYHVQSAKLRF